MARSGIRVRGYDLCAPLVDFWDAFQHRREDLFARLREESAKILTPEFAPPISPENRAKQKAIFAAWRETCLDPTADPFERGVSYMALNRCAFSGMSLISGARSTVEMEKQFGHKALAGLETVPWEVESVGLRDAVSVVREHNSEFLYLDPPYVFEDKSKESLYGNRGDLHKDFDHVALRDALDDHSGQWMLSYSDVPYVREIYRNYNITALSWTYVMAPGGKSKGQELVITNY